MSDLNEKRHDPSTPSISSASTLSYSSALSSKYQTLTIEHCCASASLTESLHNELMCIKAQNLIEHLYLFLSQCNDLNDRKIGAGDSFEEYLKTLDEYDCVDWFQFIKRIDRATLQNDEELKKFSIFFMGKQFASLSSNIHDFTKMDLILFSNGLETTSNKTILHYRDQFKSLVEFLSKPGRFDASVNQKQRLRNINKIL